MLDYLDNISTLTSDDEADIYIVINGQSEVFIDEVLFGNFDQNIRYNLVKNGYFTSINSVTSLPKHFTYEFCSNHSVETFSSSDTHLKIFGNKYLKCPASGPYLLNNQYHQSRAKNLD